MLRLLVALAGALGCAGSLTWSADSVVCAGSLRCTDGELRVHIDPSDRTSPQLVLKVAMARAAPGPAPQGPMLVHCGGPGSGKSCAAGIASRYPEFASQFDLWSIDQRGIGDSLPSLSCPESSWKNPLPPPNQTIGAVHISDLTSCDCAMADSTRMADQCYADLDPENSTQVRQLFDQAAQRNARCYGSPQFRLQNPPGHPNNTRVYNLLDWVGTTYLAHDIDAMRESLGADRMSVFGLSYGTSVGAAYGSLFPQRVHRLVLNGNMPPFPQLDSLALMTRDAEGTTLRKLLQTCNDQPGCPLYPDAFGTFDAILAQIRSARGIAPLTNAGQPFKLGLLIPGGANKGAWGTALYYLSLLARPSSRLGMAAAILDDACTLNPPSSVSTSAIVTWRTYGVCVGPPHIPDGSSQAFPTTAITGSDYAGRCSTDQAMAHVKEATAGMPTMGTSAYVGCLSLASSWAAVPTPLPPYGSPGVSALVVGNLYDPATAFVDSQRMHRGFPAGSLLTWQGVGHCFMRSGQKESQEDSEGFDACEPLMVNFVLNGTLPPRGHVCHSRLEGQFNASHHSADLRDGANLVNMVRTYMAMLRRSRLY